MWALDPANSADLMRRLDRHARGGDLAVAWVGEGWRTLVEQCHAELEAAFPDYELLNVKEQYGALRFQAFPRPWSAEGKTFTAAEVAVLDAITDACRERSQRVCEWCGTTGALRDERLYWGTLCDACNAQMADPPGGAAGHLV